MQLFRDQVKRPAIEEDWVKLARYGYGGRREYRVMCVRVHESTGGKCVLCGRDSKYVHHAIYWAWWRWVADVATLLMGGKTNAPVWQPWGKGEKQAKLGGLTQGREIPGWTAFAACEFCHPCSESTPKRWKNRRGVMHSSTHWREWHDEKDQIKHCWHGGNRFWMLWALRIMWFLRRAK